MHPPLQGEMIQAKFGSSSVAERQLEIYSTAVLLATERPPKAPRCAAHLTGCSTSACLSSPSDCPHSGATMKLPASGGPGVACEGWPANTSRSAAGRSCCPPAAGQSSGPSSWTSSAGSAVQTTGALSFSTPTSSHISARSEHLFYGGPV